MVIPSAGFPVPSPPAVFQGLSGFSTLEAQGVLYSDYECEQGGQGQQLIAPFLTACFCMAQACSARWPASIIQTPCTYTLCFLVPGMLAGPESLIPGACGLRDTLTAASTCLRMPECRAVVVLRNGGCPFSLGKHAPCWTSDDEAATSAAQPASP